MRPRVRRDTRPTPSLKPRLAHTRPAARTPPHRPRPAAHASGPRAGHAREPQPASIKPRGEKVRFPESALGIFLVISARPPKKFREFARGRIIPVFGCGGDRDVGKRPIMGEIAGQNATFAIITSDNPRSEDPFAIIDAIELGMKKTDCEYICIENRRDAIRYAIENALPEDIIVLAGKGHETYQEINGVKYPFDEKVVVAELLAQTSKKN